MTCLPRQIQWRNSQKFHLYVSCILRGVLCWVYLKWSYVQRHLWEFVLQPLSFVYGVPCSLILEQCAGQCCLPNLTLSSKHVFTIQLMILHMILLIASALFFVAVVRSMFNTQVCNLPSWVHFFSSSYSVFFCCCCKKVVNWHTHNIWAAFLV